MADRRVLVAGGGLAGFAAAQAAAAAGARVTVAWRAPGATALYAGAMEIAAPLEVLGTQPDHPLNRLGLDQPRLGAELEEACTTFSVAIGRAGLALRGGARDRGRYADLHGRVREASLVPGTVAPGELEALRGKRLAVVGVPAVGEYQAEATAAAIHAATGVDTVAVECEIEGLGPGASVTDLFGRPAPRPQIRAEAIAYPPGFTDLPPTGFELLAAVPSPHGWRLQQAVEAALAALRVEVVRGEITGFETRAGSVLAARLAGRTIEAEAFVLATGRFIGGGLRKEREIREPLLGLTVFFEGGEVSGQAVRLRHLEYLGPEPAFRAGLRTDPELRPLGSDGRPAYRNLRAAGSILGGRDYDDGFGFGVPLVTGRLAGAWSARG